MAQLVWCGVVCIGGDASKAAPGIIVVSTEGQLSVAENRKPPTGFATNTQADIFNEFRKRASFSSMNGIKLCQL